MPLGTAKLGGVVFSKHLHHLAQNAIPKGPLHDKCAGEETNATQSLPLETQLMVMAVSSFIVPPPSDGVQHKDLLAPKFDKDVVLQNIATTSVLLAAAPTVCQQFQQHQG
jgi:hypothetical protein